MQTALIIIGITSASLAGSAFGYWGFEQVEQRKLRASYLLQAGAAAERQALGYLHVRGLARTVIEVAMASSDEQGGSKLVQAPLWYLRSNTLERLMKKAGLGGELSIEGCARARMKLALSLAIAGLVCGMLASEMLALIGCLVGFIVGYRAPQMALEQEVEERANAVERELSQLVEVLVLGLKSGLSFDRSLELYCHYFSCGLSHACKRFQAQSHHGFLTRAEGLRALAESYDSPLFERVIESIIRSLRFGTSMAETLSNAGIEIRATRKTKLEEKVAKAPVKMLIPIGTLILPAMLIFILGPIILELIEGF